MKLQQLRYLCQIVDSGFNITAAADVLHTSQSGMSRQIRLLEDEIGAEILLREGNRISGLTRPGIEIVASARRLLSDAAHLKLIPKALEEDDSGTLTVAMFHLHARFSLQPTITAFCRKYPGVRLQLSQLDAVDIAQLVAAGTVDIGITTAPHESEGIVHLPAYPTSMHLYVAGRHPLLRITRPSLLDIAKYPLIALDPRLSSGQAVSRLFERHDIRTNIVMTATNTDVIKAHVAGGLGIAFLRRVPLQPPETPPVRTIPVSHLIPPATAYIVLRRNKYLKRYVYDFIQMINSKWSTERIKSVL